MKTKFGIALLTLTLIVSALTVTLGMSSCEKTVDAPYLNVTAITMRDSYVTLVGGLSGELSASLVPSNATNQEIVWTSEDSELVQVQAGPNGTAIITAGALDDSPRSGTTRVTATSLDSGKSVSAVVQVLTGTLPAAVGVDKPAMSIKNTRTGILRAVFTPAGTTYSGLQWETSDPDTVAIRSSNGLEVELEALQVGGPVTVTVKALTGGFTASSDVSVTQLTQATAISLDSTLALGLLETKTLTAALTPADANEDLEWTVTGDPDVVTVASISDLDAALVAGTTAGTATLTVKTLDGSNLSASCAVTLTEDYKLVVRNLAASPGAASSTNTGPDGAFFTTKTFANDSAPSPQIDGRTNGNATLVYLSQPITGSFTWTAKMAVTPTGGAGSGIAFWVSRDPTGALTTPGTGNANIFGYFAGMRSLVAGATMRYYTDSASPPNVRNNGTTVTLTHGAANYITFEIKRDSAGTKYIASVTPEGGTKSEWEILPDTASAAGTVAQYPNALLLDPDAAYYPGFHMANATVTISEMSITRN
jgi:uncharacterized protein YjdB